VTIAQVTRLSRLGDLSSGAGAMVFVSMLGSFDWRLAAMGGLLMAMAIGLYPMEYRRARSVKSD